MTPVLAAKGLVKRYGRVTAMDGADFELREGEVLAVVGDNGAGKSTTIGLIRGDTRPSDKVSDVLIEDTSIVRQRAAARANLGVCPQFDAMDQMTAVEHLRFYARARGVQALREQGREAGLDVHAKRGYEGSGRRRGWC